jgi:hypothetical protein
MILPEHGHLVDNRYFGTTGYTALRYGPARMMVEPHGQNATELED